MDNFNRKGFLSQLGKRLRALRKGKKISQEKLAYLSDVSYPMISKIEQGRTNPSICLLARLALVLDIPISDLLDFPQTESRDPKT